MTISVAIASENDDYDGEIYRELISIVLGVPAVKWTGGIKFSGCRSVAKQAGIFLARAASAGVRHALLAVDNDGGSRFRLEHRESDATLLFDVDDSDSCRECWLSSAVPTAWVASGGKLCVAVPVQTIETWLLVLDGQSLVPSPEQVYDRAALKKRFLGKPTPPAQLRLQRARNVLRRTDALSVLAARPSFSRMQSALRTWIV